MLRYTLLFSLLVWNSLTAASDRGIYYLIQQRLAMMKDVAAYKWIHQLPIENVDREAMVIESATFTGLQHGIKTGATRGLFAAQISAAKEIQRHWFAVWHRDSPPDDAPDLETSLRPDLIRLGADIVDTLSKANATSTSDALRLLQTEGLSIQSIEQLHKAVRAIQFYDGRLQQILDAGILRVGTTGDYAPFSIRTDPPGKLSGIDIDLAHDFASSLGVELKLVATTWPSLSHDLASGKYDVAMSGVSRNEARQQIGYFSLSYHRGGKTPISRCRDKEIFTSLERIDRAATRLIVNPGGTNERFVDKHIRHAEIIVHDDNRTIFRELINDGADVMITDRIEVQLQTRLHPTLCSTMPETNFTTQEKAYLMPQDDHLKQVIDDWLRLRLTDGTVAELFSLHLEQPAQ